jgi:hypothetical protein
LTPAEMLRVSADEGVLIHLTHQGGLSIKGNSGAVRRWSAVLKTRKPELVAYLIGEVEVMGWLSSIGETDPAVVSEVLNRCRQDPDALQYFLRRANPEFPLGF